LEITAAAVLAVITRKAGCACEMRRRRSKKRGALLLFNLAAKCGAKPGGRDSSAVLKYSNARSEGKPCSQKPKIFGDEISIYTTRKYFTWAEYLYAEKRSVK